MAIPVHNDWKPFLDAEYEKAYYQKLHAFLAKEYRTHTVYPDMYDIFNAYICTPYKDVKVCIIGQDPYHGPSQAHGLSFSVKPGVAVPPSLQNIYKELNADLGYPIPTHGNLTAWTAEGVMLLNAVLTVRAGEPASHRGVGWETFTDRTISALNARKTPVVFILWGAFAQSKENLITNSRHHIIASSHPSPFSANRGFFGSKPFSRANEFLKSDGLTPVNWEIPVTPPLSHPSSQTFEGIDEKK